MVFDITQRRIHGERVLTEFVPQSIAIGNIRAETYEIPRVGLKSQKFEAEIAAQVEDEQKRKKEQDDMVY